MVHYPPLSRLMDDQPEGFVEEPSVSGRSTPRLTPVPDDFRHDVRFHGAVGGAGISVYCQPCHWGCWIDDSHDLADLIRLVAMHGGYDAAKELCLETLAQYASEHEVPESPPALEVATPVAEALPVCVACGSDEAERERLYVLRNGAEEDSGVYCTDLIGCGNRIANRLHAEAGAE